MRMSEAYSVLSNTNQRAKYDRDILRLHQQHHDAPPPPRGSYSSTGPAGGRPASGLSHRRGTFRGPPPSFYRSGGWGAHGAKRSAAHEESTSAGSSSSSSSSNSSSNSSSRESSGYTAYSAGGMGPGQEPFGKGSASGADIPHFDRTAQAAHTRTHARYEERRARRTAPFPGTGSDFGEFAGFFSVLAVLGVAVGLPYIVLRGWNTGQKRKRATAERQKVAQG